MKIGAVFLEHPHPEADFLFFLHWKMAQASELSESQTRHTEPWRQSGHPVGFCITGNLSVLRSVFLHKTVGCWHQHFRRQSFTNPKSTDPGNSATDWDTKWFRALSKRWFRQPAFCSWCGRMKKDCQIDPQAATSACSTIQVDDSAYGILNAKRVFTWHLSPGKSGPLVTIQESPHVWKYRVCDTYPAP